MKKMTIRTITISNITEVDFDPDKKEPYFYKSDKFIWIKNKSPSAMYASADNDFDIGGDGVLEIPAGECAMLNMPPTNIIYLSGDGDAEIYTSDVPHCPWTGGSGGGSSSGGGTDNYSDLSNKPKINGVTLTGDKSFDELNLKPITKAQIDALFN